MKDNVFLPPYVVNNESPVMSLSQTVDWGLLQLDIQKLHSKGITGKGVRVAVLDTGCEKNHPDLKVLGGKNLTRGGDINAWEDKVGHGTHVAGIIGAQGNEYGVLGVAPDCHLYIYKVLGGNSGSLLDVRNGIIEAANDNMKIINMSLGSPADILYLEEACDYAKSKGCIIVCAAGNSGKNQKFFPGAYESCYATGAINKLFQVSAFSTYGDQLEFVAPGEKILSTYLRGGYAVLSGTSMASPFAAGCIALMIQAGVKDNYDTIVKSSRDINDPDWDIKSGWGVIDPGIAINKAGSPEPTQPPSNKDIISKELENISHSVDTIMGML